MSTLWTSSRHLATITKRHLHVRASARPMGVHKVIRARAVRERGQSRAPRAPARARGAAARRRSIGPDPPAAPRVRPASRSRLSVAWRRSGHPMRMPARATHARMRLSPADPPRRLPQPHSPARAAPAPSALPPSRSHLAGSRRKESSALDGQTKSDCRHAPPPVRRPHRELAESPAMSSVMLPMMPESMPRLAAVVELVLDLDRASHPRSSAGYPRARCPASAQ